MKRFVPLLLWALSIAGGVAFLQAQAVLQVPRHSGEALPGQDIVVLHDSVTEHATAAAASS